MNTSRHHSPPALTPSNTGRRTYLAAIAADAGGLEAAGRLYRMTGDPQLGAAEEWPALARADQAAAAAGIDAEELAAMGPESLMTGPCPHCGYPQEEETAGRTPRETPMPAPTLAEPHPERFSVEAAENGGYPALCDDKNCGPCQASAAAWHREELAPGGAEDGDLARPGTTFPENP